MSSSFLLKATVMVVPVLAATAGSSYIPATIANRDFLFSPIFLWVAANAIILWLVLSSSRRAGRANADDATAAGAHHGEVAMDGLYTSCSEYEAFSDASSSSAHRAFDSLVPTTRKQQLSREARAAARKADRPRVRKKPAPSPRAVAAVAGDEVPRLRREETPVVSVADGSSRAAAATGDEDEDVSMDSLWESIVQRRAARPVVVQKSESWGNDELPRLQRVAETAAATTRRGEMRKSVSAVSNKAEGSTQQQQQVVAPTAAQRLGWRTREVLVGITPDELLRRAESFIRRQHEHLRLQRQESEQRQLQLQRRLHAGPAMIRV
ncbi:hypothetical protein HU200_003917 [Digitaria exilis]|uniref:Uncharacterized protein n=1 Tax=Digitaria exilis TaxID=1010633 RepID=A0A835FVJ9_9POAL|nr:hypothetical protein HU200_003917 [Digitaria exilis]